MFSQFVRTGALKADAVAVRWENTRGLLITGLLLGLFIWLIAAFYVTPRTVLPWPHAHNYARLSEQPFNFEQSNPLQYRILAPVIGYVTGFRGRALFPFIPLLFGWFLLSAIYIHYRKQAFTPTAALIFTAFIGFSNTLFIPLYSPGYTDTITYFFIFMAYAGAHKNILFGLLLGLAVFNHESALFAVPPLLVYFFYKHYHKNIMYKAQTLLWVAIPIVLYFLYRYYVSKQTKVELDHNYYLNTSNIIYVIKRIVLLYPLGIFYAFRLFWFFPAYIVLRAAYKRELKNALPVFVFILFISLQLLIAYDITRLLCLSFPVILLCAEKAHKIWGDRKFVCFSVPLIIFNFLVPPYFIAAEGPVATMPVPLHWLYLLVGE